MTSPISISLIFSSMVPSSRTQLGTILFPFFFIPFCFQPSQHASSTSSLGPYPFGVTSLIVVLIFGCFLFGLHLPSFHVPCTTFPFLSKCLFKCGGNSSLIFCFSSFLPYVIHGSCPHPQFFFSSLILRCCFWLLTHAFARLS